MSEETKGETERRRDEEDLRAVMSTPAGRRFVWHIIDDMAGTFGKSFTGEPLSSAFNEGRRSIGLNLMNEAQALAPDAYKLAFAEALLDTENARREAERAPEE